MTPGCGGCQAANRGGPARNHNEECRKRITDELRNTGDIRFEKEQEKMEKLEPEEQQEQQQQSGGPATVDDEMPVLANEEESDDEKENEEMAGDDSEDEKVEDEKMDAGVMQISGLTLRSRNRIGEMGQKKKQEWDDGKTRKWDDDVSRMKEQLKEYGKDVEFHITEVYSPPRVNAMAQECGLIPGFSLDLTTVDPDDGRPWDFNCQDKADKAEELIRTKRPLLLIGSPMCAAFSQLQTMNFARMSEEEVKKIIEYGTRHLEFCCKLYRIQIENGPKRGQELEE